MSYLVLLLVLSAVTYRVGRFIALDTLIDAPRLWLMNRLEAGSAFGRKINELLGCPFCVTIWVSAGAVGITLGFQDVPYPVWTWLAVATGSLVFWAIIDSDD